MVTSCCAFRCRNRHKRGSGINFFRIPNNDERKELWIDAIGRDKFRPSEHSRICSSHFISGRPSNKVSDPDYVPSIFPQSSTVLPKHRLYNKKLKRLRKSQETLRRKKAAEGLLTLQTTSNKRKGSMHVVPGVSSQTDKYMTATYLVEKGAQTNITGCVLECVVASNVEMQLQIRQQKETIEKKDSHINTLKEKLAELAHKLKTLKEEQRLCSQGVSSCHESNPITAE